MLSSQTRDQATADAMSKLKKFGLTVENIVKADEKDILKCIDKVGFRQRKAS